MFQEPGLAKQSTQGKPRAEFSSRPSLQGRRNRGGGGGGGGARGAVAPLHNYWGDLAPPPPVFFLGPLWGGGGEFPPQTITNFVCFLDIFHILLSSQKQFPPPPPQNYISRKNPGPPLLYIGTRIGTRHFMCDVVFVLS